MSLVLLVFEISLFSFVEYPVWRYIDYKVRCHVISFFFFFARRVDIKYIVLWFRCGEIEIFIFYGS